MTRIINAGGRAAIVVGDRIADIATNSDGRFGPDIQGLYSQWAEFSAWAATAELGSTQSRPSDNQIDSPVPAPRQAIAVGLNYRSYLEKAGLELPTEPGIFAKLFTALGGPFEPISIPSDSVTTETEVVVVIGKHADSVSEDSALDYVAGITVGQDLTDAASVVKIARVSGDGPGASYVNPGKSRPGFAPVGPEVVTLDEAGDLSSLRIQLEINGELVQDGSTADSVFSIPQLVAKISAKVPLLPGDIIFTGSPGRIPGTTKSPLVVGDAVVSRIVGIGEQSVSAVGAGQRVAQLV